MRLSDSHSLADFKRHTAELVEELRKTGRPQVLTVKGRATVVVQDVDSYQRLLDQVDRAEAVEGIRQGLKSFERDEGRPIQEVSRELHAKHGLYGEPEALLSLGSAFGQLAQFADFQPNWDADGSPPPTATALTTAAQILVLVAGRFGPVAAGRIRPYAVAPMPGGGVYLEWQGPAIAAEVHVGPEGQLGYLIDDRTAGERRFDEQDETSLTAVLEAVQRVVGSA